MGDSARISANGRFGYARVSGSGTREWAAFFASANRVDTYIRNFTPLPPGWGREIGFSDLPTRPLRRPAAPTLRRPRCCAAACSAPASPLLRSVMLRRPAARAPRRSGAPAAPQRRAPAAPRPRGPRSAAPPERRNGRAEIEQNYEFVQFRRSGGARSRPLRLRRRKTCTKSALRRCAKSTKLRPGGPAGRPSGLLP